MTVASEGKLVHAVGHCDRCGRDGVKVHGRRVGGGSQVPTCNACMRNHRSGRLRLAGRPKAIARLAAVREKNA